MSDSAAPVRGFRAGYLRLVLTTMMDELRHGTGLAAAGGKCIHEFSQSTEPVRSAYKEYEDGMCYPFAVDWVVRSSEKEGLFWDRLYPSGHLDLGYIGHLLIKVAYPGTVTYQHPTRSVPVTRSLRDYEEGVPLYLHFNGFKARPLVECWKSDTLIGDALRRIKAAGYANKASSKISKNYFFLLLLRGMEGHALALWLRADGTVNFFDANFGEYSFRTLDGLTEWADVDLSQAYKRFEQPSLQIIRASKHGETDIA
jgi:hypothetical protein